MDSILRTFNAIAISGGSDAHGADHCQQAAADQECWLPQFGAAKYCNIAGRGHQMCHQLCFWPLSKLSVPVQARGSCRETHYNLPEYPSLMHAAFLAAIAYSFLFFDLPRSNMSALAMV
eukprot:1160565-Pelagomonas_calceolata.AAC.3